MHAVFHPTDSPCQNMLPRLLSVAILATSTALAERPLGIDVSHWQGPNVNWAAVRASGVSFAWCKASEGVSFVDSTFARNLAGASAAGVLVGGYHYARPDEHLGRGGAAAEAAHYWSVVGPLLNDSGIHLMPVLDIEQDLSGANPAYTRASLSDWVNTWCATIVNHAAASGLTVTPVVYTYVSYASSWMDPRVTRWPLWMAQWPASPDPQTGDPSGTSPWATWRVWQYSSTGQVPGVPGHCDQDVFNGDAFQLDALVIGGGVNAPRITSQPSDRWASPGGDLTLRVAAEGASPLSYQWRFNVAALPTATNGLLSLASIQPADDGLYSCVVSNAFGSVTSRVARVTVGPIHVPVFEDDFDTNNSARWQVSRSSSDTRASFAYDYSILGIPPAPHATTPTTRGLRLDANITAGAPSALSLSPTPRAFPATCRLRFDMWINANGPFPAGGTGSTEMLTAGIGTLGNTVHWSATRADGVWFAVTGEGGVSDIATTRGDFAAYVGSSLQTANSGAYAAGTDSNARGNFHPYYKNVFPGGQEPPVPQQLSYPGQTGGLNAGTVGLAWHEVIINRNGNTIEWFIDGLRIATVVSPPLNASNVFVGYWDPFSSLADIPNLNFGLIDNLRVEVPAVAPAIVAQPESVWSRFGANVLLNVAATGVPTPSYQWRRAGADLPGATNSSLTLTNLQAASAGTYSVVVSNLAGTVISAGALLSLAADRPPRLQLQRLPAPGAVALTVNLEVGATYLLETSTNLIGWERLNSLVATNVDITLRMPIYTDEASRYYRLRSGP